MSFFERYAAVCLDHGIKPMSEQAAQKIGVKRATISAWKTKNTSPKSETVTAIAEAYGVSPDYLLGRTDDPTDYTNPDLIAEMSGPVLDELGGDVKKAAAVSRAAAEDVRREKERAAYAIVSLYEQLDETDRAKAEAFIQGLLAQDKYLKRKLAL